METATASTARRLHYAWITLAMSVFVVFGSLGLARFGYGVVLPAMQTGLTLTNTQSGALVTANLIGYLALAMGGGALAARYGPRNVISLGLMFTGLGMLFIGRANGFASAAVWGAVAGLGCGASNVPVMSLLNAWFGRKRRGLAAGIAVAGSSVAMIVIGPLVPRILSIYGSDGWRMSWSLFGGAALALAALSFALLRNRPAEMGLRPAGDDPSGEPPGALPTASGESKVGRSPPAPLDWNRVYRSAAVWHLGLVYVTFGFSYIIFATFYSKSLIADAGYTKEAAGNLFMLMGWCGLVSGLVWGTVSDAIGRKWALVCVYLIHATTFALFALWRAPAGFVLAAVIFGFTAWSVPAIMSAMCGDLLGPRLAPAALGFITLFFGLGQAVGPSVAGAIADARGSFAPVFIVTAVVSLVGAGGLLMLRSPPSSMEARR